MTDEPKVVLPKPYWKAKAEADHNAIRAEAIAAYKAHLPPREACPYPYGTAKCDIWWNFYDLAKEGRIGKEDVQAS